jgi:AraC family transcriptional regulator, transcriptional activator of pobA
MTKIPIRQIKSKPKEPNLVGSFNIRSIHELLDGEDLIQELHRHDFFFILLLKKGSGFHEIDFIEYKVCNYSIFFMRPGQVHQITLRAGSTGYLMQFNSNFYYPNDKTSSQLLQKASTKNLCQLDAQRVKKILGILAFIFQEDSEKQEGYLEVIKSSMSIFFIELVRHRQNKNSSLNEHSSYSQLQLEKFVDLIETHIFEYKQVSKYAEMLHLSTYQLNAITKTTLNKTASDLINEYMILEAKRNLLATSNLVNQIADDLGHEDVSYFIRFFKKHTGYSPEAFRQNFK